MMNRTQMKQAAAEALNCTAEALQEFEQVALIDGDEERIVSFRDIDDDSPEAEIYFAQFRRDGGLYTKLSLEEVEQSDLE